MIEIDISGRSVLYSEIVEQIRLAIAGGKLRPGDRLEPVRTLARQLGVNPSTVARAYRLLEQEGIIETNRRRGSIVAASANTAMQPIRTSRLRSLMERSLLQALAEGFTPEEIEAAFGLQLAAWRERRLVGSPPATGPDNTSRLHRFAGSHDLALETLWAHLRRARPEAGLIPNYLGSLDGLLALLHGEVVLAGSHLMDEESGEYNIPILRRLFVGQSLRVITLAERQQGLILPPGNPKRLRTFADLGAPGIRIVNRQPGSGTRTLLDHHLRKLGIPSHTLAGYRREVTTHLAVAEAVESASADTGVGLLAAARAFDLEFVPLVQERYDLVMFAEDAERPIIQALTQILRSDEFKRVVNSMGGYSTELTGQVVCLS